MDSEFFDSLFEGDSANGAKLGMGLTGGDFWPRISGCSLLYRGLVMETIDFDTFLTVADSDASQISPPDYIGHTSNTIYFYIVRRANNCGDLERTLTAAAKMRTDANGDLAIPQPNEVFQVKAQQITGSKVQLVWYYCPLEQESAVADFKIYYDAGTGQIDYQNPLATVVYTGRKFYSYQTSALGAGEYLFAIRAEDASGTEDGSFAKLRVELIGSGPAEIDILSAETV